jgi:hypothetical protein
MIGCKEAATKPPQGLARFGIAYCPREIEVTAYSPRLRVPSRFSRRPWSLVHSSLDPSPRLHHSSTGLQRLSFQLERAMFPTTCNAPLETYELYLDINTRINTSSKVIPTANLRSLRVSGTCFFDVARYERLENFVMVSVKGNYFDTHSFAVLRDAPLVSFAHVQADSLAYDIRDDHLQALVTGDGGVGRTLRTLILVGCRRLTTAGVATCVRALPMLEYFALALVMQDRPSEEFVCVLPRCLRVLKIRLARALRWSPSYAEERRAIWSAVERDILPRTPPLDQMWADDDLDIIQDFSARWISNMAIVGPILKLGAWSEEI